MKKTIGYLMMSAVVLSLLVVQSCSKKHDELPKIDGYNNSNEVSSTHLVAHWTFDNNNNESFTGAGASNTYGNVGFEAGVIGQALKLDSGALVYPEIAAFNDANALNNFTVSMWVKVSGTKGGSNYFSTFFSLAPNSVSDIWPDIFMGAETSRHFAASDTIELKILMDNHATGGIDLEDNIAQPNPNSTGNDVGTGSYFKKSGPWTHFVATWDATTHKWIEYGNAVDVGAYNTRTGKGVEVLATPVRVVFGSFAASDFGFTSAPAVQTWAPPVIASIDDVRIYNTALSPAEVSALFNLGTAGR